MIWFGLLCVSAGLHAWGTGPVLRQAGLDVGWSIAADAHWRGLEPRPAGELQQIFKAAYGIDTVIGAASLVPGLRAVGRALHDNDLAQATMVSLMLRLPDINPANMTQLADVEAVLKANFNPFEPRSHGEWSRDGEGSSGFQTVQGAVPFTGIPMPGFPGTVGAPRPQKDDEDYVFPPSVPGTGTGHGANDNTQANTQTATNDNRPETCPDPSYEPTSVGRKRRELLYQAQINKLPPGWHVMLNGVGYDGCRDSDGVMLEAKSGGEFLLRFPEFLRPVFTDYKDTLAQAERQNDNSGKRFVEWHFANEALPNYWSRVFWIIICCTLE